jgi:hypothetical protein
MSKAKAAELGRILDIRKMLDCLNIFHGLLFLWGERSTSHYTILKFLSAKGEQLDIFKEQSRPS